MTLRFELINESIDTSNPEIMVSKGRKISENGI